MTFNDHEGSTRSYAYTREHYEEAVHTDFVPPPQEIAVDYAAGETQAVTCTMAVGCCCARSTARYDPTDRAAALEAIQQQLKQGEYLTGLLYIGGDQPDFHQLNAARRISR